MDSAGKSKLWKAFPKVELHRHLEGAFNIKTLFRIAKKNKLDVPEDLPSFKRAFQFPRESPPNFLLFLSKFKNTWYRSLQDVYDIVYESVKTFKNDNLFYVELRFNPEHFALYNNFDRPEVTNLIIDAGNRAALETGLKIAYIISFNRGQFEQNYFISLYKKLLTLGRPEIVGVDLAGDELSYPVKQFSRLFRAVNRDAVWKSTIHAGEVTPPSEIWEAIKLGASRIGHGTSSIQDSKLPPCLTERGIVLEQCITSNRQTGSWPDEKTHPFGVLYRMGTPVTLNSDDPAIQNTELSVDYAKAEKYFSFTLEDFIKLNLTAIEGCFLPEKEKKRLKTAYKKALASFKTSVGNAD
jgi:adenosine deaminase